MAPTPQRVRVFCRVRPLPGQSAPQCFIDESRKAITVKVDRDERHGVVNNQKEHYEFLFDNLLYGQDQAEVFEQSAEKIVESCLEGYNGTIMAYGQTGAGKTYTMSGAEGDYNSRGLIPRAISKVFEEAAKAEEEGYRTTVKISYLEIYNERMCDLLRPQARDDFSGNVSQGAREQTRQEALGAGLEVIDTKKGGTIVRGLSTPIVNSEEEALDKMFEGQTNRMIAEHAQNSASSRSHCILTLYIEKYPKDGADDTSGKLIGITRSKLHLVDLAGSERASRTKAEGNILQQANYINKSLTFLEQVVVALADKRREHVPYRQTTLTNVLKDSLGGNSKTTLIACIWPDERNNDQTICTLKFATRMMRVKIKPVLNVEEDKSERCLKLERDLDLLKRELIMHDMMAGRSGISYQPLSQQTIDLLTEAVDRYVENPNCGIQVMTVRHIEKVFSIFRDKLLAARSREHETPTALAPSVDEQAQSCPTPTNTVSNEAEETLSPMEEAWKSAQNKTKYGHAQAQSKKSYSSVQKNKENDGIATRTSPKASINYQGPSQSTNNNESGCENEDERSAVEPTVDQEKLFEQFLDNEGRGHNESLRDIKANCSRKKKEIKDLIQKVNTRKMRIDKLLKQLEIFQEREKDRSNTDLETSEDYARLLRDLKDEKKAYRESFGDVKEAKSEMTYLRKVKEQYRQRLKQEFESWKLSR